MTEQHQTNQTESVGARLARLRRSQNITQEGLAERLEVSRQAVSKWESDLTYPETEKLLKLARLYGCTVDYLLTGAEPAPAVQAETDRPDPWTHLREAWSRCPRHFEYKSRRTVGSLPLVHVNIGLGRTAKGVFAVGLTAKGVVSVGLASVGVFSVGLCSAGLASLGLFSLGLLLAVGCIALGGIAIGAIALGILAIGALSAGLCSVGALAAGHYLAVGDHAYGMIAIGKTVAEGQLFEKVGAFRLTDTELTAVQAILRAHCPAFLRGVAEIILRISCS